MPLEKVYLQKKSFERRGIKCFIARSKKTIPKYSLKGYSGKYWTEYKAGAHSYFLAKPGYKLVWE